MIANVVMILLGISMLFISSDIRKLNIKITEYEIEINRLKYDFKKLKFDLETTKLPRLGKKNIMSVYTDERLRMLEPWGCNFMNIKKIIQSNKDLGELIQYKDKRYKKLPFKKMNQDYVEYLEVKGERI